MKKAIVILVCSAVLLLTAATAQYHFKVQLPTVDSNVDLQKVRLEYYKEYVEFIKIILIGFFVGLITILIPNFLAERKYEFATKVKAKLLYSEAKTGINYLPYRLQFISEPEKAIAEIQELHVKKHLTETYYNYLPQKNKAAKRNEDRIWDKYFMPYELLTHYVNKLQENKDLWNDFSEIKRYEVLIIPNESEFDYQQGVYRKKLD